MKIELTYDGKNYFDPVFTFMWNNEKNDFAIGISFNDRRSYQFIIDDIIENFEDFKIKDTSFCYYTKENVYVFNLKNGFNLIPINKVFEHCVVLLDKDDNIIEQTYKYFKCTRNGNII
jgi:hypothetical protein